MHICLVMPGCRCREDAILFDWPPDGTSSRPVRAVGIPAGWLSLFLQRHSLASPRKGPLGGAQYRIGEPTDSPGAAFAREDGISRRRLASAYGVVCRCAWGCRCGMTTRGSRRPQAGRTTMARRLQASRADRLAASERSRPARSPGPRGEVGTHARRGRQNLNEQSPNAKRSSLDTEPLTRATTC